MNAAVPPPAEVKRAGKYLTFQLNNQEYGIEITKVIEILGVLPITPIPQAPHYVKGVINLRGVVIPVVDTRTKFGLAEIEHTSETCIIVVDVNRRSIGLIVDTVKEVIDIAEDQIEDSPDLGGSGDNGFIRGVGKIGDRVNVLLDIDVLLSDLNVNGM